MVGFNFGEFSKYPSLKGCMMETHRATTFAPFVQSVEDSRQ